MNFEHLVGLRGGEVFHYLLSTLGVDYAFGYPGGAALPLFDGIYNTDKFHFILTHHEQGAGHMAEGYAQATRKPGVVLVTSGPGTSNLATPMLNALLDGNPMVVICGQVPTTAQGTNAFQEIDVKAFAKPCTKWLTVVNSIEELPLSLEYAFKQAMCGRQGPVLVAVPKDVSSAIFSRKAYEKALGLAPQYPGILGTHTIEDLVSAETIQSIRWSAQLIDRAEQPVIIAGHGVLSSHDGPALLAQLSAKAHLPVATTLLGLGSFDESRPEAVHMIGTYGAVYANYTVQNADLILVLGARLDERAVADPASFTPKARAAEESNCGGIIQFNIEPRNVNKVVKVTGAVYGDLTDILPFLISEIRQQGPRNLWLKQIQTWKENNPFPLLVNEHADNHQTRILPHDIVNELNRQIRMLPTKAIITTGVGQHQMWAARCYQWRYPRTFITSGSMGTMGFGLPAAIGAQLGCPGLLVVDLDGDCSFNMTMEELLTASQHGIPVKILIFDNHEQRMITQFQQTYYNGRCAHAYPQNADFALLAKSMGCLGRRCKYPEDLKDSIQWLLEAVGPAVLDVELESEPPMLPIVRIGASLDTFLTDGD
ncbi:thiamine pyrophosphate enzyme, N-terminal TPP binding domain-containing protein [Aspergillus alliaceus]|uniref:thiamine pyrophosphate enzyme, N-terminal TPP binding domain-containing protein n=1 Tax=Petromyces alliaceus TaxID=209559 RepID=UPI0012A64E7A|nr:thiamine pyrophosphate enzyme, N-terminal TPP binding domain-containing protein [Aspergillus alliaceus]KAB8229647.1 thiamine pyrophosphate enzyme, N-terminal TPP binding domain-containing protein [Aspergillus alliaceus]